MRSVICADGEAAGSIGRWADIGVCLGTREQVVNLLRQIEVAVANGTTATQASTKAGESWSRRTSVSARRTAWLQVDQANRLKELEPENSKLNRLVANLSLQNPVSRSFA
ncbi:MAG: hypothetical protein NVSMB62_20780 [Acidobacteriaceae bacterium]